MHSQSLKCLFLLLSLSVKSHGVIFLIELTESPFMWYITADCYAVQGGSIFVSVD